MDALDLRQEERKKSFKPLCLTNSITEREGYAMLLRKNYKKNTIEKKRLRVLVSEAFTPATAKLETSALEWFLTNFPDFLKESTAMATRIDSIKSALQNSPTEESVHSALFILRQLTMGKLSLSFDTNAVYESGIVGLVLKFIDERYPLEIRSEASWVISNLLSCECEALIQLLADLGVVPLLLSLLDEPSPTLNEHGLIGLANYTATSEKCRESVLKQGVVEKMEAIWAAGKVPLGVKRAVMFLTCNLLHCERFPEITEVQPLVTHAAESLWDEDCEILGDSLWALSFLSSVEHNFEQSSACKPHIIKRIIFHLKNPSDRVRHPALRCIGNISSGQDSWGILLVKEGVLDSLESLLGTRQERLIKETCWIISNLVSCGPAVIEVCIKQGILSHIKFLLKAQSRELVREAMWVLCNAISVGNEEQVENLVQLGIIEDLGELLGGYDVEFQCVILKILIKVMRKAKGYVKTGIYEEMVYRLQASGGVTNLERLQVHENTKIYEMAVMLMKEHYEMEEVGVIQGSLLSDPPMFM